MLTVGVRFWRQHYRERRSEVNPHDVIESEVVQEQGCRCGEMADAQDLKSWARNKACGFKSHHRHHLKYNLEPL